MDDFLIWLDARSRVYLDGHKRKEKQPIIVELARAYRTCTSGKDFPCELCAQNSGDVSRIKWLLSNLLMLYRLSKRKHASRVGFIGSNK